MIRPAPRCLNRTMVNGKECVRPQLLRTGDRVGVGNPATGVVRAAIPFAVGRGSPDWWCVRRPACDVRHLVSYRIPEGAILMSGRYRSRESKTECRAGLASSTRHTPCFHTVGARDTSVPLLCRYS
jgi:hypothetical protein